MEGQSNFSPLSVYLTYGASYGFELAQMVFDTYVGTHRIVRKVVAADATVRNSDILTLTILAPTPTVTLLAPTLTDQFVIIPADPATYTIAEYTSDYSGADLTIAYQARFSGETDYLGSTPVNGVTFDADTRTFSFDPTSKTAGTTYTIQIIATPSIAGTATDTVHDSETFTVTYVDVILTAPMFDFPVTRSVTDPTFSEDFDPYTVSYDPVTGTDPTGVISYTAELENGDPLPDCIVFNSASRSFSISCNSNVDAGDYSIRIVATEDQYDVVDQDELITISITEYDFSNDFLTTVIPDISFIVGTDTETSVSFDEWTTTTYSGTLAMIYEVFASDGVSLPPSFVSISGTTITITNAMSADEGTHTLAVRGTDDSTETLADEIVSFNVIITLREYNQAPEWGSTFTDQSLREEETILYVLPFVTDLNAFDTHQFTLETDAAFVSLDTDLKVLNIEPQLGDSGEYEVTLTVTDNDSTNSGYFLSSEATFLISVSQVEKSVAEPEVVDNQPVFEVDWQALVVEHIDPPVAEITEVNNFGEIKVSFSQKMMVPVNFTQINNSSLEVNILTKLDLYDPEFIVQEWKIMQFTEQFMRLKVTFKDPLLVSSTSDLDKIQLVFIHKGFFISGESFKPIESGTSKLLVKELPMQLADSSAMDSLGTLAGSVEAGSSGFALGSLLVQLLLAGSLQLLWGMVNTLQIIVQLPLINISLPPNAMMLSSSLVSLASFDFLPLDKINTKFFGMKAEPEEKKRYNDVGMNSTNFVLNCGTMFFSFFIWFGLVILHAVLKLLSRFSIYMKAAQIWLSSKIFYGLLVVLLLESYLEVLIASFVQVKNLNLSSLGQKIIAAITIFFCIVFSLLPFIFYGLLNTSSHFLLSRNVKSKWSELYSQFKLENKSTRLYNFYFLLRRLTFAAALIFSESFVVLQMTTINIGSFVIILYVLTKQPYSVRYMNQLEVANEATILALSYITWSLSDYQGSVYLKLELGWLYCFVILFCVFQNFIVMLYFALKGPITKCKAKRSSSKNEKTKQKLVCSESKLKVETSFVEAKTKNQSLRARQKQPTNITQLTLLHPQSTQIPRQAVLPDPKPLQVHGRPKQIFKKKKKAKSKPDNDLPQKNTPNHKATPITNNNLTSFYSSPKRQK